MNYILLKFLIISILISNISFADDAYFINKDQSAKFSGYLIPEDKTKELYNSVLERDSYKTQLDLINKNIDLYKQENSILLNQNSSLIKTATENHTLNSWEKAGYFFGGLFLTALAIEGAQKLRQ